MINLTNKIIDAQVFAMKEHSHKEYDDGIPYSVHLNIVVEFIRIYIQLLPREEREDMICAGWLHDSGEDVGVKYGKIKSRFGFTVAEIVGCVTDEWGRNRKERITKTLPKTASNRRAVYLKLCDRMANVYFSIMTNNNEKYNMYLEGFEEFKTALYKPNEYDLMWNDLEHMIHTKTITKTENKQYEEQSSSESN